MEFCELKCILTKMLASCTAVHTLSVLQKLGDMTPEMTVSPLYIRAPFVINKNSKHRSGHQTMTFINKFQYKIQSGSFLKKFGDP